jgi:hypothetical protein
MLLNTHLACQGCQDGLGVDQGAVAQVVEATLLEDLGTSLEPHSLTEGHAVLGQQLGGDAAQSACRKQQQHQQERGQVSSKRGDARGMA